MRATTLICAALTAFGAHADALLVKGAWPSASDALKPLPEGGAVVGNVYENVYFGIKYVLGSGWNQQVEGPPPSESGFYVLAQLEPTERDRRLIEGHTLIAAQDMFFGPARANSPAELIDYARRHLDSDLKIDRPATKVRLAGRDFVRFDYHSVIAQMQWHILATQIRCHTVEFVFTGQDARRLNRMVEALQSLEVADRDMPICLKDYANSSNLLAREEPAAPQSRFNPVPVRIIIGPDGKIEHIHFISAFPEQTAAVTAALAQWRFKPYLIDGRPVAVETGVMFGRPPAEAQAQNAPK